MQLGPAQKRPGVRRCRVVTRTRLSDPRSRLGAKELSFSEPPSAGLAPSCTRPSATAREKDQAGALSRPRPSGPQCTHVCGGPVRRGRGHLPGHELTQKPDTLAAHVTINALPPPNSSCVLVLHQETAACGSGGPALGRKTRPRPARLEEDLQVQVQGACAVPTSSGNRIPRTPRGGGQRTSGVRAHTCVCTSSVQARRAPTSSNQAAGSAAPVLTQLCPARWGLCSSKTWDPDTTSPTEEQPSAHIS